MIGRIDADPYGAADTGVLVGQFGGQRMAGQERREVRAHRDRADAGAAAAVRDAERLVQVQVADVAAELARPGQPDQRVEVGAVDVDLTAGVVHGRADLGDVVLVHAVGRRVGDHERGQPVGVLGDLGAQVVEVDVAVRRGTPTTTTRMPASAADAALVPCALDGIRQMSRCVVAAARRGSRGSPAGRRTRPAMPALGCSDDRVVAGEPRQPASRRSAISLRRPGRVGRRRERVLARELRPGDRLHLGGRVELHRARAERDHAAVQRDVLVGQRAQVAHHRGLGAVAGERRVGAGTADVRGSGDVARPVARSARRRDAERRRAPRATCASVVASSQDTETWSASTRHRLMPLALAAATHLVGAARHPGQHGVEERVVHHVDTAAAQPAAIARRVAVHPPRDRGQPVGAVVARVHRGHHRQQHLRGADVARSPCRGGCAVRGSAAPAGRPASPSASTDTPTSRPGSCRACLACTAR